MSDNSNRNAKFGKWRALIHDTSGSTSTESTILFGAIATCLVVGVCFLGHMCRVSLNATSSAMSSVVWLQETRGVAQAADSAAGGQLLGMSLWLLGTIALGFFITCGVPIFYIMSVLKKRRKAISFSLVAICLTTCVCALGQLLHVSAEADAKTSAGGARVTSAQGDSVAVDATRKKQVVGLPIWVVMITATAFAVACGSPILYIVTALQNGKLNSRRKTKTQTDEDEIAEAEDHSFENNAFEKRQQLRRVFENNMASLLDGHLKVRQIMSRQLTCAKSDASVESVRAVMKLKKIQHVMITDSKGALIGTVSDEMLSGTREKVIRRVMTHDPFSLDADSDLSPAVTTLIRRRINCIPVTTNGKLVGIVTLLDLLVALQCALHSLANIVQYLPATTSSDTANRPQVETASQEA